MKHEPDLTNTRLAKAEGKGDSMPKRPNIKKARVENPTKPQALPRAFESAPMSEGHIGTYSSKHGEKIHVYKVSDGSSYKYGFRVLGPDGGLKRTSYVYSSEQLEAAMRNEGVEISLSDKKPKHQI